MNTVSIHLVRVFCHTPGDGLFLIGIGRAHILRHCVQLSCLRLSTTPASVVRFAKAHLHFHSICINTLQIHSQQMLAKRHSTCRRVSYFQLWKRAYDIHLCSIFLRFNKKKTLCIIFVQTRINHKSRTTLEKNSITTIQDLNSRLTNVQGRRKYRNMYNSYIILVDTLIV